MVKKLKLPKFEVSPIKRFILTYKRVFSIVYKVNPRLLISVTIINGFWGLTNLPVLYINKTLIDVVIGSIGLSDLSTPLKTISLLIFFRALVEFARAATSNINSFLTRAMGEQLTAYLERVGGVKLNTLDIPLVESPNFQDKYKKIEREANNRLWGMIEPLSDIPNAIFTIISGVLPLITFNPWISVVVLVVTLPDIIINARIAKKDYEAIQVLNPKWRLWGWIHWHMVDTKQFYENKILGNVEYLARKLFDVQKEIVEFQYKRRKRRATARTFASIPGYILSMVLNIYFFALALLGRVTLGTAQLLYQATNTLSLGFSTFLNDAVNIYENYLFVSDLTWFLELKAELVGGQKQPSLNFSKGIEFKDVWFKYPNAKTWVLKGVSFEIGPKENLALVGENGAGKTTMIKLLSGFYKPNKGEVLVNGVNIFDYDQAKYRQLLGVLFQDFSWYPFTARESIGIGSVDKIKRREEIKKYAKLTGVDEFIESLPLKYENPLSKEFEKGVEPSKGQWQRIALSRILFRDSKILVLDEPTSNVDPKAEEEIFEKIIELAREKILILISHRFSTVRMADKILLIDGGKIWEQGTHQELMNRDSEYAHLFKLQAKGYQ
ncbi:MAG: ABC transporter related protein [Candidatus Woesebacteria bacterium GW2011_GWB1_39_12]|uniref:ABC transporter related protein n=2 Tax=Candidatus Woeseibacteriota TaxID=1752722 RepID=A0A0G0M294_9BACT|nr:MAG: ABC transporter related protein [Candidatus Woesebacteria bacterium GW2011_GWA1_39_12]KKR00949.1 MAG: ABC transporter related protein [Candidatus Woesebacteria bacterium GW2011_GWB1_39_12]